MKKLVLIDGDGVVLNWDDPFEWWAKRKYGILKDETAKEYTGGVYGRYHLTFANHPHLSWMELVAEFNASDDCANLPPLRDSIRYIKELHECHGYVFQVITAFSLSPYLQRRRIENLKRYFGTAIAGVEFADLCGDKTHLLKQYEGAGIPWVEDKLSNAEIGMNMGLDAYLMMHSYNYRDALKMDPKIIPVADWSDMAKKLVGPID